MSDRDADATWVDLQSIHGLYKRAGHMSRDFWKFGRKRRRGRVPNGYSIVSVEGMIGITKLIEKLAPLVLASAPVVGAIRKLVADSRDGNLEARIANLEKAMELQSALNEKIDVELKIVHTLLEKVQRFFRSLIITVIVALILAVAALAIALMK